MSEDSRRLSTDPLCSFVATHPSRTLRQRPFQYRLESELFRQTPHQERFLKSRGYRETEAVHEKVRETYSNTALPIHDDYRRDARLESHLGSEIGSYHTQRYCNMFCQPERCRQPGVPIPCYSARLRYTG